MAARSLLVVLSAVLVAALVPSALGLDVDAKLSFQDLASCRGLRRATCVARGVSEWR